MRIHSLEVDNFRSFNKEIINFNDSNGNAKQFIVLIGDNGVGKTAILEAITKCFVPVIRTISNEAVKKCDLTNNDIKYNCGWTSIKTKIEIDNKQYYLLNRRRVSSSISINDNMDTKEQKVYSLEAKSTFLKRREEGKLPLILYYGINRVFNEIPKRGHIREYKIDDALKNCFDNSNNFRDFYEWYKTEEDIELRELRENNRKW